MFFFNIILKPVNYPKVGFNNYYPKKNCVIVINKENYYLYDT